MFYSLELLTQQAKAYTARLDIAIENQLGCGLQGVVFLASNQAAIKVHADKSAYDREVAVYGRLAQHSVSSVRGFNVPIMRAFDDELRVIEMSVVKPPFVLDFGGAYVDRPSPHAADPENLRRWMEERSDKFGDSLKIVNAILADFEVRYRIFLTDVHPGNIRFL